jgi:hypothetical protein
MDETNETLDAEPRVVPEAEPRKKLAWHTPTFRAVTIDSVTGSYRAAGSADGTPGYSHRS